MNDITSKLTALDKRLVAAGFPATSPWWRETLARFYASAARTLVVRVGRRGGKSSTLCRVAVAEALYGEHTIPPGDVGVVAIISVSRDEATQRLRTIKAILDALGVKYKPVEGGIELEGRPIVFKTFAASIAGVSGFTCVLAIADETSKWRDSESGANPAKEVLGSLRPTMATQPNARLVLSSSPLGHSDAHFEAFARGDTDKQITAYAPTWEANPSVSEQDTHDLEPDDRIWRREYMAIPQAGALGAFDVDAIDRCFLPLPPGLNFDRGARVMIVDPSSGRADAWTWGICSWIVPPSQQFRMRQKYLAQIGRMYWDWELDASGERIPLNPIERVRPGLQFELIDGVDGNYWANSTGGDIVARLADLCRTYRVRRVIGDQREELMLAAMFQREGIKYTPIPWTGANKPTAVERVRRWMREKQLILPVDPKLRHELLTFDEKITPSGSITFGARGRNHDDRVALLITAALADEASLLAGSPVGKVVYRDSNPPLPGTSYSMAA